MKVILGGVLLLAVAMGIGRFSYTVLLASLFVVIYSIEERKLSLYV